MAKIKSFKQVTDGDFRYYCYELPRYFEVHIYSDGEPYSCFRYKKKFVKNHDEALRLARLDLFGARALSVL